MLLDRGLLSPPSYSVAARPTAIHINLATTREDTRRGLRRHRRKDDPILSSQRRQSSCALAGRKQSPLVVESVSYSVSQSVSLSVSLSVCLRGDRPASQPLCAVSIGSTSATRSSTTPSSLRSLMLFFLIPLSLHIARARCSSTTKDDQRRRSNSSLRSPALSREC